MPIPLIIAAAVAGTALFTAIKIFSTKDKYKTLAGEKFSVLGLRQSGKSTFLNFLNNGSLPEKCDGTLDPENFKGKVTLQDFKFNFNAIDVGGDNFSSWKYSLKESNYIIFLLNTPRLLDRDKQYQKELSEASYVISTYLETLKESTNQPKVILLGTFLDVIDEKEYMSEKTEINIEAKLKENLLILDLYSKFSTTNTVNLIVGSLKTQESTQRLTLRMLNFFSNLESK